MVAVREFSNSLAIRLRDLLQLRLNELKTASSGVRESRDEVARQRTAIAELQSRLRTAQQTAERMRKSLVGRLTCPRFYAFLSAYETLRILSNFIFHGIYLSTARLTSIIATSCRCHC
ncbi:unnamed protein product [Protopolystoma xenopodis]|uniref:Uncharacterized protein n=1 Tax=Protopolystoma xenopodis TaxID=117903 RepID=A0A3S5CNC3_9PLAT|nr:unnamed protein product [Protopolystoma xenopodis]